MKGKCAVVTGAASGLGRAIALRLAEDGAAVAVHYHSSRGGADETVQLILDKGGHALAISADGRNQQAVQAALDEAAQRLGGIDVLVNNAGQHRQANSLEQPQSEWDDLIARNLSACYFFAQAAARHMKARGGGQIVNISSKMAQSTAPSNAAYCAAKAGIVALTQVLAVEWARHGIRVNCVAPGVLGTEATNDLTRELDATGLMQRCLAERTPVGRLGEVDEIAAVVAFFALGEANFMTGSTVMVDGGWTSYGDYIGWRLARSLVQSPKQT